MVVSAFIHLTIMSSIIFVVAPIAFHASIPPNFPLYFMTLALFILVSFAVSCTLGLSIKSQTKLTMYSQVVFLPSIMLSGIMFSAKLLPDILESIGKLFPATWGYTLLTQKNIDAYTFIPLLIILFLAMCVNLQLLKKAHSEQKGFLLQNKPAEYADWPLFGKPPTSFHKPRFSVRSFPVWEYRKQPYRNPCTATNNPRHCWGLCHTKKDGRLLCRPFINAFLHIKPSASIPASATSLGTVVSGTVYREYTALRSWRSRRRSTQIWAPK